LHDDVQHAIEGVGEPADLIWAMYIRPHGIVFRVVDACRRAGELDDGDRNAAGQKPAQGDAAQDQGEQHDAQDQQRVAQSAAEYPQVRLQREPAQLCPFAAERRHQQRLVRIAVEPGRRQLRREGGAGVAPLVAGEEPSDAVGLGLEDRCPEDGAAGLQARQLSRGDVGLVKVNRGDEAGGERVAKRFERRPRPGLRGPILEYREGNGGTRQRQDERPQQCQTDFAADRCEVPIHRKGPAAASVRGSAFTSRPAVGLRPRAASCWALRR
jgi:hypothetical protein